MPQPSAAKKQAAPLAIAHVYILVRLDLPHPHLTVQAAHAAITATFAFGEPDCKHPNLVICGVANERELADVVNRLKVRGVRCCAWYEDDMNNELTAVATAPLRGEERKPMKRFKLLGANGRL